MAACLQHGTTPAFCVNFNHKFSPKMLPLFSNISYPIPTQPLLHMVQHFPVVSIPLLLPSNSSTLPLFLPPLFARHLRFNHHHHYLYNISYCIHCVNILQFIHIIWSSCRVASYRQLNKFIPINVPFNEPILLETTIRWSPPLPSSP